MDHLTFKSCIVEQGEAFLKVSLCCWFMNFSPHFSPHRLCQPIGTQAPENHKYLLSHSGCLLGKWRAIFCQVCDNILALLFLFKTGKFCTFVAQKFVTAPLAFNSGFEAVSVIWAKLFHVNDVLGYTGRLQKPNIGSVRFKRLFL